MRQRTGALRARPRAGPRGFTTEWNGTTPIRVRLVERGAGLPPDGTRGDFDAYRDQVGWLRLGAPAGTGVGPRNRKPSSSHRPSRRTRSKRDR